MQSGGRRKKKENTLLTPCLVTRKRNAERRKKDEATGNRIQRCQRNNCLNIKMLGQIANDLKRHDFIAGAFLNYIDGWMVSLQLC